MESLDLMLRAGEGFPQHVIWWMNWMQLCLILAPLLLIKFRGAQVLFAAQIANFITAYFVFVADGHEVTRLFGLGHAFWIIGAWFLIKDFRNTDLNIGYRAYTVVACITIAISLVFDVRDVAQWVMGERGPLFPAA